jgi:hypothetical protein
VDEYFSSGDVGALSASLEDLDAPQFMYWAVKKLVTLAMDKRPHEREMASVALSALYGDVVSGDQMQTGFIKMLEAVRGWGCLGAAGHGAALAAWGLLAMGLRWLQGAALLRLGRLGRAGSCCIPGTAQPLPPSAHTRPLPTRARAPRWTT